MDASKAKTCSLSRYLGTDASDPELMVLSCAEADLGNGDTYCAQWDKQKSTLMATGKPFLSTLVSLGAIGRLRGRRGRCFLRC